MNRGEVWTVAGGSAYSGKPRPAVIVQSDLFAATASVVVCPLTTDPSDAPIFRPLFEPTDENGLRLPCRLMVDKLTAVPRARLGRRTPAGGATASTGHPPTLFRQRPPVQNTVTWR